MPSRTNCRVSDGRLMALNYVLNFRKLGILAQQLWPFLTAFWNCWRFFRKKHGYPRGAKRTVDGWRGPFFMSVFLDLRFLAFLFAFLVFASFSLLNDGDIPFRNFSSKGLPHLWWAFNEQQKGEKKLGLPNCREAAHFHTWKQQWCLFATPKLQKYLSGTSEHRKSLNVSKCLRPE